MKNVNLIEMLRGCSKRNGMAVSASNPDGQPTVNRQSRLMSHQGYLRNLAMIFAVLVMSVANIDTAWGDTSYPSTGSHSRAFYSITSITAAQTMSTSKSTNPGYAEITSGATITGGKAYVGVQYTSSSTKGLTINNSNCWKIDQNYIWCVINSTDPFVAGDTIYISNGGKNAYALSLNRATNATADYSSNSSTYTASTTTPVKGTEYYFVLPANFVSSNYLVINKSNSGNADFSYLYACHAAAAKAYTVTAATSTGDNTYGTVAASAGRH